MLKRRWSRCCFTISKSPWRDGSTSCASRHDQGQAFADAQGFSAGVGGQSLACQSLPLANAAGFGAHYRVLNADGMPPFLWDGRTASADEVSLIAITSPHEMNMTLTEILERIHTKVYYRFWAFASGLIGSSNRQYMDEREAVPLLPERIAEGTVGGMVTLLSVQPLRRDVWELLLRPSVLGGYLSHYRVSSTLLPIDGLKRLY